MPPLRPELFDFPADRVWAMHCAVGPLPKAAAAAAAPVLEKALQPWTAKAEDWLGPVERTRAAAARLFGVAGSDLTFTAGTSAGLVTVAQSFPWSAGDEVLLPLGEFPSNVWPWKALEARGVTVREVPLWDGHLSGARAWESSPPPVRCAPEERLLEALGARTRILAVSWVRFQDGLRLDLAGLATGCAQRGVALVVDGIQGAGTLPSDWKGAAAFSTGVHKGLLGAQGLGLLWTAPAFRERLAPFGSWLSVEEGAEFDRPVTDFTRAWLADGHKLEHATPNNLALAPLEVSLGLLADAGPETIERHVRALQKELLTRLARVSRWRSEAERLSALVEQGRLGSVLSLHHAGAGPRAWGELLRAGFAAGVFASVREGYLRIALHGFHDEGDLERLAGWLGAAGG